MFLQVIVQGGHQVVSAFHQSLAPSWYQVGTKMRMIMLVLIVSAVCLSTVQVSALTATCLSRQQLRQAMIGNAKLRGIPFTTTPESGQIRRVRYQAALRLAIIRCKAEGEGGMKAVFDELVGQAKNLASQKQEEKQTWIAIAGAPGSGKSTLCTYVAKQLNDEGFKTIVVPMDGFHYYRRELDAMPDPVEAHSKRGAHWTFNSRRLVDTLQKIRSNRSGLAPVNFAFPALFAGHPAGCKLCCPAQHLIAVNFAAQHSTPLLFRKTGKCILAFASWHQALCGVELKNILFHSSRPSLQNFDHAEGDPVEDAITVEPSHKIVIVEGSFLLLGTPHPALTQHHVWSTGMAWTPNSMLTANNIIHILI